MLKILATVLLSVGCVAGFAQTPVPADKKLEFEVASVRQNKTEEKPSSTFSLDSGNIYSAVNEGDVFIPSGGYFSATNQPLWRYIVFAYKLSGTQELALRFNFFAGLKSNVPGWVNSERFDIKGRVEGNPTKDEVRMMLQALLLERFKLSVHRETREVPELAMVLVKAGKMGPKLQPHGDSCAKAASGLPEVCGVVAHLAASGAGQLKIGGRDVSLALLASALPTQTGMATLPYPVVDATGLSGTFDFSLEWAPEVADPAADVTGSTFVSALKEQLGIRLESRKGPIDLIVLDHIEQPSAN